MRRFRLEGPLGTALFALALGLGATSTAHAHPLVDQGISRYEGADFAGALRAFAEAEASDDLTRDDLVQLLEGRALVHLALGAESEMEAALGQLASLTPHREMGRAIPPPMREAFTRIAAEAGTPIAVEATTEAMPGGTRIRAEVRGDRGSLVREVRIGGRPVGGEWTTGTGTSLSVVTSSGAGVEYYVQAIGPGGAVLAANGTPDAPNSASSALGEGDGASGPLDDDDDGGLLVPILIGAGALLVVAAVVIIIVAASSGGQSDDTQFSPPMRSP